MSAKPTILVASGTANTGHHVVEQLSQAGGVNVRALARNPDSDVAKTLAKLPNVTVVKGDFEDPASLKAALEGVSRAFLVSGAGDDQQYDREVAFIKAATDANLEVVVRVSTANCLIDLNTTCVYARAHARVEQYIAEHKSRVIDLQPNWYISNLLWQAAEIKGTGKLTYPVTLEEAETMTPIAMVDTRDVAGAGVAILLLPKDQLEPLLAVGRLEVHGKERVTFAQNLAALSKAAGKDIALNPIEPDGFAKLLESFGTNPAMAGSFRDTVLSVIVGSKATPRPRLQETTPALAAIWTPKHTVEDWCKTYGAAFA